ncbi:MAG: hypothetical protein J0H82_06500 [Alphaproteobacteria bacterium]|nr:hypothetical protein [Alphaproteobacteria bacterium]
MTGEVPPKSRQPGARRPALALAHGDAAWIQHAPRYVTDIANAAGYAHCCGPADCERAPEGAIRSTEWRSGRPSASSCPAKLPDRPCGETAGLRHLDHAHRRENRRILDAFAMIDDSECMN